MDAERVQDGFPAMDSPGGVLTVLPPLDRREIQHFERGLVGRAALRPSQHNISTSLTPRFFNSDKTPSQNLADSPPEGPTQRPRMSRSPLAISKSCR